MRQILDKPVMEFVYSITSTSVDLVLKKNFSVFSISSSTLSRLLVFDIHPFVFFDMVATPGKLLRRASQLISIIYMSVNGFNLMPATAPTEFRSALRLAGSLLSWVKNNLFWTF